MKTITISLPQTLKSVNLHILSDWHIGDLSCRLDDIEAEVKEIQNDPNAFAICNGDLCNTATKNSVSDCYCEQMPVQKQIEKVATMLQPIRDKIIGFANGNHEARVWRESGVDISSCICSRLDILDKYVNEGGLIFLRFGLNERRKAENRPQCYTIYFTHGSGGGRKEGAKAIRLADMACIIDADVYVHSHTHLPMILKENYFRVTPCTNSV